VLTPDERRGVRLLLVIAMAGLAWDLGRARWPETPATAPPAAPSGAPIEARAQAAEPADTLDLNRASAQELESLPGIGPVLARRICDHRQREGPFRSVEELRAVRGIGPRLLARIRDRLRVSSG